MASSTASTPFPLGVYVGNPDDSSAANQAAFQAEYDSFTRLMGTAPRFLTSFIDQRQTVAQWVGNSMWAADSARASASARASTPVIALPLASNAAGSASAEAQYNAFAAGQYDGVVRDIVKTWASRGFNDLVFRPGWEMNIAGPTYAGDSASSQAAWVRAFQHVSTVLHQEAAAQGVSMQVVWNPATTNYSNASATGKLYPGDAYVDVIGADIYSDMHPYSDGGATPAYHDWNTGGTDTTVAQFIADPVNRMHYWSLPAATKWSDDGSGGRSQSLASLIQFAQAHGKPFAVPETGAGNSDAGVDVKDDAAFPQWLAQQLTAAQAAGTRIAFVGLWDSNGGGNYEFSSAGSGKPNEAAAWAKYFGAPAQPAAQPPAQPPAITPTPTPTPTPVTTVPVPTPPAQNTLVVRVSEDAWNGDAQFTIAIDGTTIGGVRTATASHAAGRTQDVSLGGSWGQGPHTVGITFLNDAYGGTAATDRNLYVQSVTLDGRAAAGAPAALMSAGRVDFAVPGVAVDTKLRLHLAEDAWNGDAQYAIAIDGVTVGSGSVSALNGAGQSQAVDLRATLSAGQHELAVSFLNDAYGGTAATDRNLYVKGLEVNGATVGGASATLLSTGTTHIQFTVPVG